MAASRKTITQPISPDRAQKKSTSRGWGSKFLQKLRDVCTEGMKVNTLVVLWNTFFRDVRYWLGVLAGQKPATNDVRYSPIQKDNRPRAVDGLDPDLTYMQNYFLVIIRTPLVIALYPICVAAWGLCKVGAAIECAALGKRLDAPGVRVWCRYAANFFLKTSYTGRGNQAMQSGTPTSLEKAGSWSNFLAENLKVFLITIPRLMMRPVGDTSQANSLIADPVTHVMLFILTLFIVPISYISRSTLDVFMQARHRRYPGLENPEKTSVGNGNRNASSLRQRLPSKASTGSLSSVGSDRDQSSGSFGAELPSELGDEDQSLLARSPDSDRRSSGSFAGPSSVPLCVANEGGLDRVDKDDSNPSSSRLGRGIESILKLIGNSVSDQKQSSSREEDQWNAWQQSQQKNSSGRQPSAPHSNDPPNSVKGDGKPRCVATAHMPGPADPRPETLCSP